MTPTHLYRRTAVAAVLVLLAATSASADFRLCEQVLSNATIKLARARYTLLRKCNDAVVKGVRPGPCPDVRTSSCSEWAGPSSTPSSISRNSEPVGLLLLSAGVPNALDTM